LKAIALDAVVSVIASACAMGVGARLAQARRNGKAAAALYFSFAIFH
jgi:hypothetical protein